jgi:hypothetical protein
MGGCAPHPRYLEFGRIPGIADVSETAWRDARTDKPVTDT